MAAVLPIATILVSLLAAGATSNSYTPSSPPPPAPAPASYTPSSPPPPASYTPSSPPPPASYTPSSPPPPASYTPSSPPPPVSYTPSSPPPPAPAAPASHTPTQPPAKGDKRIKLRVEGLVYCQSCAQRGSQSLDGGAPLPGAKVTVTCRDRKNRVMAWRKAAADENGYFLAKFGVERLGDYYMGDPRKACFVRLLSSPVAKCNDITNINGGMVGARLRDEGKRWTGAEGYENVAYSAGPLAFKPSKCVPTRPY